ncbi:MAG: hypothetical protein N2376_03610 [Clostridia bacterium]|nr:hypothetical protein [Clostridia bacterium]
MTQIRMVLIILVIGLLVAALQIVIWRFSKDRAFFKYIPSLVLFIVGAVCVVKAVWFSTGMEDLAYFVLAMLVVGVLIISVVTGLLLDIITRIKR